MIKYFKIIFTVFIVAVLLFSSCDKIKAPYALARHGNITDTVIDWDTVVPVKRVLLEDYTGHTCQNCPAAAVIAHNQDALYHGKLVVLAVHAGYYAEPGAGEFAIDFRTTAGEQWNTDFKIAAYPSGMINRALFNNHQVIGSPDWVTDIASIINGTPDMNMILINDYDTTSRTVNSQIYSQFRHSMTGSYTITVGVMEDNIISAQDSSNVVIHNYNFKDVFRGAVNGTYGEILTSVVDPNLTYLGKFSIPINTTWVANNCWVIAFVSNSATKEVIQVIKQRVTTQ